MTEAARITVLAGVNGAGKSSIVGAMVRADGGEYFNPDEVTRKIQAASSLTLEEANSLAWHEGQSRLRRSIEEKKDFTFEATLGGSSVRKELERALDEGLEVAVLFVGLETPGLHIARVRSRVAAGGHDIPEAKIRERYTTSIRNLVMLAPRLTALRVFDNSAEADPKTGQPPSPRELVYAEHGRVLRHCPLEDCPQWAKPILAVLMR